MKVLISALPRISTSLSVERALIRNLRIQTFFYKNNFIRTIDGVLRWGMGQLVKHSIYIISGFRNMDVKTNHRFNRPIGSGRVKNSSTKKFVT